MYTVDDAKKGQKWKSNSPSTFSTPRRPSSSQSPLPATCAESEILAAVGSTTPHEVTDPIEADHPSLVRVEGLVACVSARVDSRLANVPTIPKCIVLAWIICVVFIRFIREMTQKEGGEGRRIDEGGTVLIPVGDGRRASSARSKEMAGETNKLKEEGKRRQQKEDTNRGGTHPPMKIACMQGQAIHASILTRLFTLRGAAMRVEQQWMGPMHASKAGSKSRNEV
ncbi:hypothetical protein B0H13DRAFT_1858927 [Mycena leptocephala]|nr:hypothetical protein B0H13DRAFT_1858927 [Mycena leptocephala]